MSYHLIMSSPLHFTLQQHSQQCQYVIVECRNPGCGQQILLIRMEEHLKQECPQRLVNCKDCDNEIHFKELQVRVLKSTYSAAHFKPLQAHVQECRNAPRVCRNCKHIIPASEVLHYCQHKLEMLLRLLMVKVFLINSWQL